MTEQSSCSTLNLRNRTVAPMAHLKDYPRGRVAEKSVDPGIEDGSSVNVVIHNYLEISLVLGRFSEENVRDLLETLARRGIAPPSAFLDPRPASRAMSKRIFRHIEGLTIQKSFGASSG